MQKKIPPKYAIYSMKHNLNMKQVPGFGGIEEITVEGIFAKKFNINRE